MRYVFLFTLVACIAAPYSHAAEIVRLYTMGEDDPNAAVGEITEGTLDTLPFPEDDPDNTDSAGSLVDLSGFGVYTEGRDGPGSLAVDFDGVDFFEGDQFDPRNFNNFFASLSQGWFKPDSESTGFRQHLWAVGSDNGGVAISEDGFYELVAGGAAGTLVTDVAAEFDEWNHLAVFRGGNSANLYLNGSLVASVSGFWNGPGLFYLGAGPNGVEPFDGAVDDFAISGFGDGSFSLAEDLTVFSDVELSGITGDVDQDGVVDENDYLVWVENAGFDNGLGAGDLTTFLRGDLDNNGRINFFDFQVIRAEAAAAGIELASVPEPAAGSLLGLAMLALVFFRRSRTA